MTLPIVSRGSVPAGELPAFHKFVCPPGSGGDNPDPLPSTFNFKRNLLVGIDLELRDGGRVPMWVIEDPDAPAAEQSTFPSRTIRIPQGALVHADVGCQGGTHTIHWHGIEPTPMNDGVGHTSFEVDGHFIHQFQPRDAGTYFYHCHKNTVLHFEMGLYGLLIVDPPDPASPAVPATYPIGGPGFVARFNPLALVLTDHAIHYDVEALWVADSIDSRWHTLGHDAFMQKCDDQHPVDPNNFTQDGFLNDFRPDIFVLTGIPRRINDTAPFTAADSPVVAPTVKAGQTLLIRVVNADYIIQRFTLGIDAEVIGADGRAFGVPPFQQYSRPFPLPAGTPFQLTSAMRQDLIVKPTEVRDVAVTVEFLNQITGKLLYTARTTIKVIP